MLKTTLITAAALVFFRGPRLSAAPFDHRAVLADSPLSVNSVTADESRIYGAGGDGILYVWSRAEFSLHTAIALSPTYLNSVAAVGESLLVGSSNGSVYLLDRIALDLQAVLDEGGGPIYSVFADGDRIYGASGDSALYIWDIPTLAFNRTLDQCEDVLNAVFADGDRIYGAGEDGFVYVWSRSDFSLLHRLEGEEGFLAVFADDSRLYGGNKDGGIYLWSLPGFVLDGVLNGPGDWVNSVYSREGYIFAADDDESVRVWNRHNLEFAAGLDQGSDWMNSVFADGLYIYGGSADGNVYVWEQGLEPSPTPTASPAPTASPTPTAVPTAPPSPVPTVPPSPSPTAFPSATPTASATPSASPSVTPTPVPLPVGISYCLPAGATRIGGAVFDTYILLFNLGPEAAPVELVFVGGDGEIARHEAEVAASSRATFRMNDHVAEAGTVSTIVISTAGIPLAVERAMYWAESEGQLAAGPWIGGHAALGTAGALEWHLAEGATHIFDQFVHVLNPDNLEAADVEVTFVDRHGASWNVERMIPPQSNWTIDVFAEIGSRDQVSTRVASRNEVPVAADRTMYWPRGGPWADGHASAGAPAAALTWRLAEGATHIFDCYLAIYNPSETETAEILIGFTGELPGIIFHPAEVGPLSRYTLKVNDVVGEAGAVSATVVSDIPVTAERAMYWPQGSPEGWTGGHGSLGAPQAFSTWRLAEGATHIFDCYLLVFNPSDTAVAVVEITFRDKNGNSVSHRELVAPLARATVKVNEVVDSLDAFSTEATSDFPVVIERAMYWPQGGPWTGGHSSPGIAE